VARMFIECSRENADSAGASVSSGLATAQTVYWHRDLPPNNAEILGEGVLEATSGRVLGTLANRDHL
jgi:hypothetical protein